MKLPKGLSFQITSASDTPIITKKEYSIGDIWLGNMKVIEISEREEDYVLVAAGWYDGGCDYKESEFLKYKYIANKTPTK